MKALPLIALLAVTAAAGTAADNRPPAPLVLDELSFTSRGHDSSRQIEIRSDDDRSSVSVSRARMSETQGLDEDGPMRFTVAAEAGRTECQGVRHDGVAAGTCRFTSSPDFEIGLAQRGVRLEHRRDLLALALVDAKLALVDDLSRDGWAPRDSSNLIAAGALGITGAWADGLKRGGLTIAAFDDLIAARALDLDGAWLRDMAAAGYPHLTVHQAISMRAVGVTPSYAAAMNRAMDAAHAVENAGGLQ